MPAVVFSARNARSSDDVKPKSGALHVDLAFRRGDLFECITLFGTGVSI